MRPRIPACLAPTAALLEWRTCATLTVMLALLPLRAAAHKVPWNETDPAFRHLGRADRAELAYFLARYCHGIGKKPGRCVHDLLRKETGKSVKVLKERSVKVLVAYARCTQKNEVHAITPDTRCGDDQGCSYHRGYVSDRYVYGDRGWGSHRHEYSEGRVDRHASEHAHRQVMKLIEFCKTTVRDYFHEEPVAAKRLDDSPAVDPPRDEDFAELVRDLQQQASGVFAKVQGRCGHVRMRSANRTTVLVGPSMERRKRIRNAAYEEAATYPHYYAPKDAIPYTVCRQCVKYCGGETRSLNRDLDYFHQSASGKDSSLSPRCAVPKIIRRTPANVRVFRARIEACVELSRR